jgi:hypothetical protein
MFGNTLNTTNQIKNGDLIKLSSCDKFNWCKVNNTKGLYVRGYKFQYLQDMLYIMRAEKPTYFYIKSKKPDNLFGYIKHYIKPQKQVAPLTKEGIVKQQNIVSTPKSIVKLKKENIDTVSQQSLPIFIYANLGMTSLNSTQDKSIITPISTDKTGFVYEFGLGYNYTPTYFTTIAFQKAITDEKNIDNIILSANYKFTTTYLIPSVGLLGGYSTMLWTKDPVISANKQRKSTKFFLGLQGQVEYKLKNRFTLLGTYQYLPYEHKTNIKNGGYLNDNSEHNIMVGLKYDIR